MCNYSSHLYSAAAFVIALAAAGCQSGDNNRNAGTTEEANAVAEVAADADLPDTTGASVWAYLKSERYQSNWKIWPDKGELYTGQEPHGMLLTTYLNDAAEAALSEKAGSMPDGAIVVKENYMPDSTLAAITVMYKVAGYNPEHSDWFFSKHLPDGTLDKAPNGMAMEGRVMGCQNCHGTVAPNDYIFTGPLSE